MNRIEQLSATVIAVCVGVILFRHATAATHASIPKDMPQNSRFVQSGYDLSRNEAHGNWIACQENFEQQNNWCRVTDQKGSVVYEGGFLPVGTGRQVPTRNLKIDVPDANKMWVNGPAEQSPVPVIPLENGLVLVPAADQIALGSRWANDPEEFKRVTGGAD